MRKHSVNYNFGFDADLRSFISLLTGTAHRRQQSTADYGCAF